MDETEYDDIYEFVKHTRNTILFNMKSPVSVMVTGATMIKSIIETMDKDATDKEDLESIYQIAVMLSDASERLMDNVYILGDNLETIANKKKNSD